MDIFPINWFILISAFAGCVLQEFIYWFELRHRIAQGEIPPALHSPAYWIITVTSIFIFSIGAYFYFTFSEGQNQLNFFTIAVFSAGFPRLFKGAVQQIGTNPKKLKQKKIIASNKKREQFDLKYFFMIS